MTMDNWKPFSMTDELAARMAAHEMEACADFVEQNRKFLAGWARKMLRDHTNVIPANEYEEGDCIDQIFVDFVYYDYSGAKMLVRSIWRSFIGVAHGGYGARVYARSKKEQALSLDAPIEISARSGEKDSGASIADVIPSREPSPYEVVAEREHVEEIAPHFYHEIKRLFGNDPEEQGGATIGEILAAKSGGKAGDPIRDIIEEIFFGLSYEEVKAYATTRADQ